jgi:hypothetical protein
MNLKEDPCLVLLLFLILFPTPLGTDLPCPLATKKIPFQFMAPNLGKAEIEEQNFLKPHQGHGLWWF